MSMEEEANAPYPLHPYDDSMSVPSDDDDAYDAQDLPFYNIDVDAALAELLGASAAPAYGVDLAPDDLEDDEPSEQPEPPQPYEEVEVPPVQPQADEQLEQQQEPDVEEEVPAAESELDSPAGVAAQDGHADSVIEIDLLTPLPPLPSSGLPLELLLEKLPGEAACPHSVCPVKAVTMKPLVLSRMACAQLSFRALCRHDVPAEQWRATAAIRAHTAAFCRALSPGVPCRHVRRRPQPTRWRQLKWRCREQ
jgi:hypothetical protein